MRVTNPILRPQPIDNHYGHLAQLVEHSTFNRTVTGSNPVVPTKKTLSHYGLGFFYNLI